MKGVDEPALATRIPLALVQQVPVYEDQGSGFDLAQLIFIVLVAVCALFDVQPHWELGPCHIVESGPSALFPYEPARHGRPRVRAFGETQTPVLSRGILQRDPESHRARRVRVQERAVLMRRHPSSDLRLFADDHALKDSWISEPYRFGDLPM